MDFGNLDILSKDRTGKYDSLDFSFLNYIQPYDSDLKSDITKINIEDQVNDLNREIASIEINSIPFDKFDYMVAFTIGILEVAGEFFISDHNNKKSIANKMSDKNTKLGEYFQSIHSKLDHSKQPLDYQGNKFGGGNHRGRTFGHDLIMFPLSIYMLCSGKFIDGYYEDEAFKMILTKLNQNGTAYTQLSLDEAIVAYVTHMVADFFSAKSLPIPGFSLLTHFPQRDIRKFANDLYKDGLNIRNLAIQGVPVATTEVLIWIYNSLRYKDSQYSKEAIKNKKEKLLLMSHGVAMSVNIGKVIITENPTSLNLVMIIRVINLIWNVTKYKTDINNKAIEKSNLSVLKNQLETMDTFILLDQSIYHTKEVAKLISEMKSNFDETNINRNKNLNEGFNELDDMMMEFKRLNN